MRHETIPTHGYLPVLDGLRALAAFLVVALHAGLRVPGDLGVTCFFALSGFVITRLLWVERDRTGTVSLQAFYLRRTLRIFPAYYALVLASIAADHVLGVPWTGAQAATALTYTANYYLATHNHVGPQAHIWSLSVEEQFYLLWPALFLVLARLRNPLPAILALIGVVAAWRSALYLGFGAASSYVYNAFDTRFDALLIGCALATLCRTDRGQTVLWRLSASAVCPALTIVALWAVRTQVSGDFHYSIGFTAEAALCALLIAQLIHQGDCRPWRWLAHPVARWLGAISYPVYLWHAWALTAADRIVDGPGLVFIVGSAIATVLAAGSYYVVERPFLALKQRASRRHAAVPTPVVMASTLR